MEPGTPAEGEHDDASVDRAPVDTAGLRIAVDAATASDAALVAKVIGDRPAVGDPEMRIAIGRKVPEIPERPADFEGPYGDHWFHGSSQFFHHHWGMDVAITADHVEMGGDAASYRRWVAVRNAMLFVLAHAFSEHGGFLLHAGAVHRSGRTLLLLGGSGAGKSTMAFAAKRSGWDLLADDMVVIRRRDGVITSQGVPRVPSIPGDIARAEDVAGDVLPGDDRDRVELVGTELDPCERELSGVVVAGHASADGHLEAIDGPTVVEWLVDALVLSAIAPALREWFPTAVQVARLPHTRLLHPADPSERVASAGRLLGTWASRTVGGDQSRPLRT